MTAPLDGDLAWAIHGWVSNPTTIHALNMNDVEIESLARHLTAAGYSKNPGGILEELTSLKPLVDKITNATGFLKETRA